MRNNCWNWPSDGPKKERSKNLPKLWGKKWTTIQKKVTNTLRMKLRPVMEGCISEEFSEEAQWFIWEGFLWKVKSLLRKEIRDTQNTSGSSEWEIQA